MPHDVTLIATFAVGFVLAFVFGYDRQPPPPPAAGRLPGRGHRHRVVHARLRRERGDRRTARRDRRDPADVRRRPALLGRRPDGGAADRGPGRGRPDRDRHRDRRRDGDALGLVARRRLVLGLCLSVASTVVLLKALEEREHAADAERPHRGRLARSSRTSRWSSSSCCCPALAEALGGRRPAASHGGDHGLLLVARASRSSRSAAFVAIVLFVGPRVMPWLLRQVARTGSRELFTLAVLALSLGIAFGSAELFGVSFALGAFFAGVVLNESDLSPQGRRELAAAPGRVRGAVLRLRRDAVRSVDPRARADDARRRAAR